MLRGTYSERIRKASQGRRQSGQTGNRVQDPGVGSVWCTEGMRRGTGTSGAVHKVRQDPVRSEANSFAHPRGDGSVVN